MPYDSRIRDYLGLLKLRVMSLVVFTGFAGLFLAPGSIHPFIAVMAIICIAAGSSAAGAINMWYERDIDAKMKRTQHRPLPSGRLDPQGAIEFATILAAASVFIMGMFVNYLSAFLLLCAILFYVFIYTVWLKRSTPQNIVIGGAAGAFPPLIGWAAVTGDISLFPILLFSIIFMWTPPHFWALSLYSSEDYKRANIPMLPVVSGPKETKKHILVYSLLLVPLTLLPFFLGMTGLLYLTTASLLGVCFITHAAKVYKSASTDDAFSMFKYSIYYLFILFASLMTDKVLPYGV